MPTAMPGTLGRMSGLAGVAPAFPMTMGMMPLPSVPSAPAPLLAPAGGCSGMGVGESLAGGSSWTGTADPVEHRKVRHNLAERRRTNRINKLFNQLYEVLVSPEVLPLLSDVGLDGQLRKLPRKSKAAVLEAAICLSVPPSVAMSVSRDL